MADAPAPGAGAKLDPQAAIAKQAAFTQAGGAGDAATIARVEAAIAGSPMGWLQGMMGEVDTRASSERSQVQGKIDESKDLVAQNQKGAPKDAGPAPAPGHPTHPAVPHPATAAAKAPAPAAHPATGGAAPADHKVSVSPPAASPAAAAPSPAPAPTIAAAVASAGGDSQLDGILNGYTPKSQQGTQMLGRIKQMGDVAQGFNGQLDVYVAQGGAVEHGIAASANFFGMGKDVSAVWANNPYRKVSGILGGIMTGLSAVKNVCSVVGGICGKLGLVLTVIGLLGMIFPPIGVAVSGIARILNVVGIICDAISFVLSGILTGLNGVVLAQQIAAGASAEEKAATADLMMSEANDAASGFVNMAMIFGPKFMKGLLGNSKGVVSSLIRRAKATIGRVSLKITGNVQAFANKIVRKLPMSEASMGRVGGAWKDTGVIAGMKDGIKKSAVGKAFYGAPQHLEAIQDKLMAKYGNTSWAKGMDRVGAWSGSVAHKFDLEEKIGNLGEKSGKAFGGIGAETKFGQSMAAAADRSEHQTRELAMKFQANDAAQLEGERWKNYLGDRQAKNPDHIREPGSEKAFISEKQDKVRADAETQFAADEKKRGTTEKVEQMRHDRFERRNDEFYENKTNGITGVDARDQMMGTVHASREKRWDLEKTYSAQETERKSLLGKASKSADDEARLTALNGELKPLDEARRMNKLNESELSGLAAGSERVRAPEYNNWKDVGTNVWDSAAPVGEMVGLKDQDSAWSLAEKASLSKQNNYNKGAAQGNAAARGGAGTFGEIESAQRQDEMKDFGKFVRANPHATKVSGTVRGMLSNITKRAPAAPKPTAATAAAHAPTPAAPTAAPVNAPPPPAHTPTPAAATPSPAVAAAPHEPAAPIAATALHEGPAPVIAPAHEGGAPKPPAADEAVAEALPYWPAMLPEFDKASQDFGWMRNVAVEFKKAQIDGKQKAVDTLAVYGRYQEYAKLRAASAEKNQAASHTTAQSAQQNADHATATQSQAGQGEAKQGEAKSSANDRAATDLPEPESRGFWGRILGAVKRWAKNKAAQVFGWIQEKIASVVLKGLCGVSMGDMREYAGALRRQQMAAHGVADNAGKQSGQVQQTSIKLGSDATQEAQGAADAIGECDRNIVDADTFMADVTSFEQQLSEEKAYAQTFIAQVHAAAHAEQAQKAGESAQQAQEQHASEQKTAQLGGDAPEPAAAAPTPAAVAAPAPVAAVAGAADIAHEEPAPAAAPEGEADVGEIHTAAGYVASEAELMVGQLDARARDYQNQLALALTNHTGKDQAGVDLKGPAKTESKHIVDEFKQFAEQTKHDMEGFHNMSIDPSSSRQIADQIIQSAEHLEGNFQQSQEALDMLFAKTYNGIKDGKRTLTSQVLDGKNVVGDMNRAGNSATNAVIDTALPAANTAWSTVAAPIEVPAAAPAPAPSVASTAPHGGSGVS